MILYVLMDSHECLSSSYQCSPAMVHRTKETCIICGENHDGTAYQSCLYLISSFSLTASNFDPRTHTLKGVFIKTKQNGSETDWCNILKTAEKAQKGNQIFDLEKSTKARVSSSAYKRHC